ncbi:MAG: NADH-quinone oxidoreductase subunit L [Pirellulales bacterium]|nr:NADH-quinone oxidoreductase subunit L [Pirellulales bacterium]
MDTLPLLLGTAWLLPLASFALILLFGSRMGKAGRGAGFVATAAIVAAFVLSATALTVWLSAHPIEAPAGHSSATADSAEHGAAAKENHAADTHASAGETTAAKKIIPPVAGDWYELGAFGTKRITIGYYIDALTIAMFFMVTMVASCIHIYSFGYMHEELSEVTDHQVTLASGQHLHRRGRFHRFYQYLSLFCFSMLGLVIAGNIAMVFVFWELVGICSYFLIGFYIERKSASNAANKAFIVNRVGDFGMIIGLMAVWTGMGTFSFGDYEMKDAQGRETMRPGIFSQARPAGNDFQLQAPDGMVKFAKRDEIAEIVQKSENAADAELQIEKRIDGWRKDGFGYGWLIVAGLGIFCGCVGKSAQFPLHVWLPDAMEGPTPVSALIHAATMVAAGVYLVGRFYPVFTPEVLMVIAYIGCITLFIAATMALVATDIKRVLAFSTVSQLGYMMLALGFGGWLAGIFHLFTHAFFKALLFLCSGSVIHATHTNEMPRMGGLLKKMPYTGITMLIGCLAIAGAGIPWIIGLSGYYSKDFIIAQGLVYQHANPLHGWLFYFSVAGAGMTSFYMFRLWYMTFLGTPRDKHVYDHAHESTPSMLVPLVILAVMSVISGWKVPFTNLELPALLTQAIPSGTEEGAVSNLTKFYIPAEHLSHESGVHFFATGIAFLMALLGFVLATAFYGTKRLDPNDARRTFATLYRIFIHKWYFDEAYQKIFVRPALAISGWIAWLDKNGLDWIADNSARLMGLCARLDDWFDRKFVDRLIDLVAAGTYRLGIRLKALQTGSLRQYVMLLAVGLAALFMIMNFYWNFAMSKM